MFKDEIVQEFRNQMLDLFRRNPRLLPNSSNELDPRPLGMNAESKRLFIHFYNDVESQLKDGAKYAEVKGLGKIAEHALRLAGCLSLIKNSDCPEILGLEMDCGIALARYYLDEALRIKQESVGNPDIQLAEKLLCWILSRPAPTFYLAEIYQKGPSGIREAAIAKRIITILEGHGYIDRQKPCRLDGSMRQDVWMIRKGRSTVATPLFPLNESLQRLAKLAELAGGSGTPRVGGAVTSVSRGEVPTVPWVALPEGPRAATSILYQAQAFIRRCRTQWRACEGPSRQYLVVFTWPFSFRAGRRLYPRATVPRRDVHQAAVKRYGYDPK